MKEYGGESDGLIDDGLPLMLVIGEERMIPSAQMALNGVSSERPGHGSGHRIGVMVIWQLSLPSTAQSVVAEGHLV